ncbi:MAG: hypothetical protein ACOYNG_07830, partial [Terrimicrobiaceae bacterium]
RGLLHGPHFGDHPCRSGQSVVCPHPRRDGRRLSGIRRALHRPPCRPPLPARAAAKDVASKGKVGRPDKCEKESRNKPTALECTNH